MCVELSGLSSLSKEMSLSILESIATDSPQLHYAATRLEFRRDAIEPLSNGAPFEVETPAGLFRMTKAEFYEQFPEIARGVSYRERGCYFYPMIPYKAFRFLVRHGQQGSAGQGSTGQGAGVDQGQHGNAPGGLEERVDQVPGDQHADHL